MDNMWPKLVLMVLALGVGTVFLVSRVFGTKQDPREPPLVATAIPYFGHVIGLMRSKFNYYVKLSQKTNLPVLTMFMPGQKMYIVNRPELIQAIQKQPKVLAFPPIEAKFASQVCGASAEAHNIVLKNVNGDEGDWGLSMDIYSTMRGALAPGAGLDDMNRVMIQNVAQSLDIVLPKGRKETRINLSEWLRGTVTKATTDSVYRPQNPFKDPMVEYSFWEFESNLMAILVGILPSIFARKGIDARYNVAAAFVRYFRMRGQDQASVLMQNRYETSIKHGVSIVDTARYEVGGALAIVVNTAPATFWMMFFIYSHPGLLEEIRKEVDAIVDKTTDAKGKTVRSLDITNVKTSCPLLMSTFQETLRHRSMGTSVRQVMKDTLLDGKWLLKKDGMVQMPSRVIHMDQSIWGTDVEDFNPRRFLKDTVHKTADGKKPITTAFRAFGGGTTLCPGRHFATNEILAVVTMCVVRFDMIPGKGEWVLPKTDGTNVAAVIMEPDTDVEVRLSARKGAEEGRWAFGLKDSKVIFAVVDEDR